MKMLKKLKKEKSVDDFKTAVGREFRVFCLQWHTDKKKEGFTLEEQKGVFQMVNRHKTRFYEIVNKFSQEGASFDMERILATLRENFEDFYHGGTDTGNLDYGVDYY